MDVDQARRLALALPEATEQPHFELTSFRVRGKIFATVPPGEEQLRIFVEEAQTRALVAEAPDVYAELWWGRRLSGVEVRLTRADPGEVAELLEDAYRRKAPKALQAHLDDAQNGAQDDAQNGAQDDAQNGAQDDTQNEAQDDAQDEEGGSR